MPSGERVTVPPIRRPTSLGRSSDLADASARVGVFVARAPRHQERPGAWERHASYAHWPPGGWGPVIKHAIPIRLLITRLLEAAPALSWEQMAERLSDGLRAAVVTREEDRTLAASGVAHTLPQAADPSDAKRGADMPDSTP